MIETGRLKELLDLMAGRRVLVVGDLMLDRFVYGSVQRISPEAPVPVLCVEREKCMPGGASNVASNIRELGAAAAVAGVVGVDAAGDLLLELLKQREVEHTAVLRMPETVTCEKARVIAESQQVVRVDRGDGGPDIMPDEWGEKLKNAMAGTDAVILEDYGKGTINQETVDAVLESARRLQLPVSLDPKEQRNLSFGGMTLITPNHREALLLGGHTPRDANCPPLDEPELLDSARKIMDRWRPELLLVTLGARGMLLWPAGGQPCHLPACAREVFDVSGAGDTVVAVSTLALSAGASAVEAAKLANMAAGVVVGKIGTATCSPAELLEYAAFTGELHGSEPETDR